MLGHTFTGANWPQAGEIDVMEHIGSEPLAVHSTVHGPGYSGSGGVSSRFDLSGPRGFSADFHTFAVDWRPGLITFLVDGNAFQRVSSVSLPAGLPWVFDQPFFVLLNVAVGGRFPGNPDATTTFPQEMVVDYVRYVP
jgi:beta-glucanase (GH16 family)